LYKLPVMLGLDGERCYRALVGRDARFDGLFFVGVSTTGIYCRPICPARTPGRDRCSFFATAIAAEQAGFRACFRCRPELAPGQPVPRPLPALVAGAVARIDRGFLNEHSVDRLARELGVTGRHLRRAMAQEIGVGPVELAQSRRLALAKRLLQDTALGLAEVAFTSGFRSVRRFNALFRARFGRPPSAVRRGRGGAAEAQTQTLALRLDYRPPLDWDGLLAFLGDRATPGVEEVRGGVYRRVLELDGRTGTVAVRAAGARPALWAEVSLTLARRITKLVVMLRQLFDLDARPDAIAAALGRDPALAPLVARRPGLRVPGSLDAFETTVRAILGQQVSVKGATTLAGRLAQRFGRPVRTSEPGLHHRFPSAAELAGQGPAAIATVGLPRARAAAVHAVAAAFAAGRVALPGPAAGSAPVAAGGPAAVALEALPGIGPWTAAYVAMRAARDPDAFPAADLGVRRALGDLDPRRAEERSQRWRPWRSYAVMHLWSSLSREAGGAA
jgi:AraC family transcriptional regulator, regulatory protein of adaptative response / DNA-3-methyladenine glycosylase II